MSLPTTATPHPSLDREYVIKSVNKHVIQTKLNVLRALKYLVLIERDLNAAGGVLRMLQYRDRNTKFEVTIAEIEAREKQLFSTRARVERGLQHYLDKTLAPECRSLFDKVQSKLPRELRDMLYANIASQMRSCQLQRPPPNKSPSSTLIHSALISILPQALGPTWDFLCKDTYHATCGSSKLELAEAWYRRTIFKITHRMAIDNLVQHDLWETRLDPRELNSHLDVTLSLYQDFYESSFDLSAECVRQLARLGKKTEITFRLDVDAYRMMSMLVRRRLFWSTTLLLQCGHVMFMHFLGHAEFKFKMKLEELSEKSWYEKLMSAGLWERLSVVIERAQ
jgi:hypothetical protein